MCTHLYLAQRLYHLLKRNICAAAVITLSLLSDKRKRNRKSKLSSLQGVKIICDSYTKQDKFLIPYLLVVFYEWWVFDSPDERFWSV